MKMRYFKSVQGLAFLRPGRPGIYIGCKRKPRDKATGVSPGFVWNTEAVTAVSVEECNRNLKDYTSAVKSKVLIEVKEKDFKAAAKAQEDAQRKAAAEAKAAKADAKTSTPTTTEEG